ncbi:MAG TPA: pilus assembly protein PilM [Candidatus Woesebacteria bacterium]|nr:pilus assembly protein PilM [Candidatus Woesebacteria bacterium]
MAHKVFSLAINEYQTRLAHLEKKKDKIELLSLGYDNTVPTFFSNPTDQSIQQQAQVIMQIYKQLNIKETKVQIVIPDSVSFSHLIVMPKLKEDELAKAIKLQVDEIIPLPISETNIDFEIVTELPDNKILVLFVALEKKIADHIAKTIEFTKLEPISLENDLSVLGRFFAEVFPFMKDPSIVINFGFNATSFYVLNPTFPYFQNTKLIKIGLSTFLKDLKMNMNMEPLKSIEALKSIGFSTNGSVNLTPVISPITTEFINELSALIKFTKEKSNISIKHIYTMNYDTSIAHLSTVIQNSLSIPTVPVPLESILVPNPIVQTFKNNLTAFLPVIAGHLR